MGSTTKVAISSDFLSAFARLPRQIQKKVTEFINKFKQNPCSPGINLEKIKDSIDKKLCSVRIDDTYRGILLKQDIENIYLLLWVDHHDEAYEWARRKCCEINRKTGAIQIFDVQENVGDDSAYENGIFDNISNEELSVLGVPDRLFSFVKSIKTKEQFFKNESSLPYDVIEPLSWIADGTSVKEVIEAYAVTEPSDTIDFSKALNVESNKQAFVVIDGEDELRKIMSAPLEKWRIFLHPTQRKIVNKKYNGSARVLGSAGTGKTVVAMHRAKYLASRLSDDERILVTTFTANLASDICENLKKICTVEEMRKIEVINLDAWVLRFLRENGYKYQIMYSNGIYDMMDTAVKIANNGLDLPTAFYEEEWLKVVTAQETFSCESYIKATRVGRGTRLDRKKKMQVWSVFENFIKLMTQNSIRDINYAMYECKIILNSLSNRITYKHIIVDEAQDFSSSAFSLIRTISGCEHENDIFIVGDAHQRIYRNVSSLSKCGINIKGRSSKLKINYRTTDETHKFAFSVLKGIPFDDLDGELDSSDKCQSLTHGEAPIIKCVKDIGGEIQYIIEEIHKLFESGVPLADICITARTHKLVDIYMSQLAKEGIRCYEIKSNNSENRLIDGIRIATMHRVKGLEFKYVFISSAVDEIVPLRSAINHTDSVSEQETITSERCLLYVAITRAQKQAYITGYGDMSPFITVEA